VAIAAALATLATLAVLARATSTRSLILQRHTHIHRLKITLRALRCIQLAIQHRLLRVKHTSSVNERSTSGARHFIF